MNSGKQTIPSSQQEIPNSRIPQSELGSFLAPLLAGVTAIWQQFHFITFGVVVVYAFSGTTIIEANQVGVILRLGEVVRSDGDPITHPPGIVFALPRPFDEVLVVEVDRIDTIIINELAPPSWSTLSEVATVNFSETDDRNSTPLYLSESIDPEAYGYVLTADRNILHTRIIVRYRVKDAVEFTLLTSSPSDFLRSVLLQSTIKTAGEIRLDDLLGSGREQFSNAAKIDAQNRLDHIGAGLEIVSLEFANLSPPEQVAADFDAVQSAYIEAQTSTQDAYSYAASVVPAAIADASEMIAEAEQVATTLISTARADAQAFAALLPSYRANPDMVRQRLYREGLERALIQAERVRLVPAPSADGYLGTRFSISTSSVSQYTDINSSDTISEEAPQETSSSVETLPPLSVLSFNVEGGSQ